MPPRLPTPRALLAALALLAIAAPLAAQQQDDLLGLVLEARAPNRNAVALIIGNSTYKRDLPAVRFAVRDAETVDRYVQRTLGVPLSNIVLLKDASLGDLKSAFNAQRGRLAAIVKSLPQPAQAEVFVYYSGHGAPTVPAGKAYLVPVDGDPDFLEDTSYPLDDAYAQLAALGAKQVTVVLDACFSGQSDQGSLFKGARPVIRVVQPVAAPKLTVFAAATGTQVSSDFEAKGHGLFTYFFLRGLQGDADAGTDGRITVAELRDYLADNVPGYARRLKNREQAPTVTAPDPARAVAVVTPVSKGRLPEVMPVAGSRATVAAAPAVAPAPAPAATAPARGAARTALSTFRDCAGCPELVVLPGGSFRMGSPETEEGRGDDEDDSQGPGGRPVLVALPELSVALAKTEVTRGEYAAFVRATGRSHPGGCYASEKGADGEWGSQLKAGASWESPGFDQGDDHPVTCVSWDDAQAYVRWLSQQTGQSYRLPTEAEWEYSARGGTTTPFVNAASEGELCRYANGADATANRQFPDWGAANSCSDGYVFTAPVGGREPNAFGLHDMIGNVWEWTADCYGESLAGTPRDGRAREASSCARRVLRGGSWSLDSVLLRPAFRHWVGPGDRSSDIGFRVARTLTP
ncbi:MAG: SUMF1/EgtB/PvdO family nonheme iron enzyme [Gemmatimonadales bacterium]|nr:SUMF1/EgtB/PvdO family nonheme iron enzyme [Gemmatimonadales bacterium]